MPDSQAVWGDRRKRTHSSQKVTHASHVLSFRVAIMYGTSLTSGPLICPRANTWRSMQSRGSEDTPPSMPSEDVKPVFACHNVRHSPVAKYTSDFDDGRVDEDSLQRFLQSPECQLQPMPLLSLSDVESHLRTPDRWSGLKSVTPSNRSFVRGTAIQSANLLSPTSSLGSNGAAEATSPSLNACPLYPPTPSSSSAALTIPAASFLKPRENVLDSTPDYPSSFNHRPTSLPETRPLSFQPPASRTFANLNSRPTLPWTSSPAGYPPAAYRRRTPRTRHRNGGRRATSAATAAAAIPGYNPLVAYKMRMEKLNQQKANARRREHERVEKTRVAFEQLKMCLIRSDPIAQKYMRCFNMGSKINILKAATAHIAELTNQLAAESDGLSTQVTAEEMPRRGPANTGILSSPSSSITSTCPNVWPEAS